MKRTTIVLLALLVPKISWADSPTRECPDVIENTERAFIQGFNLSVSKKAQHLGVNFYHNMNNLPILWEGCTGAECIKVQVTKIQKGEVWVHEVKFLYPNLPPDKEIVCQK